MRTLFTIILVFAPLSCRATLSSAIQLDVRTTGSPNNGGGYDGSGACASPGTDYSQQNSAQIAYTDFTLGSGGTSYTSAAFPVSSLNNCNLIQVISGTGCTPGFYQAIAPAGTLDRSAGTVGSVCVANLGGSLDGPAKAISAINTQAVSGSCSGTCGNTVWFRRGTYNITTALDQQQYIKVRGYNVVHGDLGATTIYNPTIVMTATGQALWKVDCNSGQNWANGLDIQNVNFSNTAGVKAQTTDFGLLANILNDANTGLPLIYKYGVMDGFSYGINGGTNQAAGYFAPFVIEGVEIRNCSFDAFNNAGSGMFGKIMQFRGAFFHNNCGSGIVFTGAQCQFAVENSALTSNSVYGINQGCNGGDKSVLVGNSVIAFNQSDGIHVVAPGGGTPDGLEVTNTIIWGNSGYGINSLGAADGRGDFPVTYIASFNAMGGNTLGNINGLTDTSSGTGPTSITVSPFFTSVNFGLNNTAGGGQSLRGAGWPGLFPGGGSTGVLDIGAVQVGNSGGINGGTGCSPQSVPGGSGFANAK